MRRSRAARRRGLRVRRDADAGRLAAAFRDAYLSGDPSQLARVLDPDVRVIVDSGGVTGRAHGPADGLTAALTLLALTLGAPEGLRLELRSVNGRPGLRATRQERVVAVIALDGAAGVLDRVWLVTNPAKLARWE